MLKNVLSAQVCLIKEELQESYRSLIEQERQNPRMHDVRTTQQSTEVSIPLTNELKVEQNAAAEIELYINGFKKLQHVLAEYIDPENGLLRCLVVKGVLSDPECNILCKSNSDEDHKVSYVELNENLLFQYIMPKIESCCMQFIDALTENDQKHIADFIRTSGDNFKSEDRVLVKKELDIINRNMFPLVNLIDPNRKSFLYRLVSMDCITNRHKLKIESWNEKEDKTDELLKNS